jgi:hypothetical protein
LSYIDSKKRIFRRRRANGVAPTVLAISTMSHTKIHLIHIVQTFLARLKSCKKSHDLQNHIFAEIVTLFAEALTLLNIVSGNFDTATKFY